MTLTTIAPKTTMTAPPMQTPADAPPNYMAIKAKQQQTWAAGDYAVVGSTLNIVGEMLAEAMDVNPDEAVLDVAAGNGNATLAAARRFARVTSTDYVEELLQKGRMRAEADGFDVAFQQADAENLPFADASFDAVMSTFGVMFTPNQEAAAAEMMRVTKPGGRVGMANWTPNSFIGALFRTIGAHVPPPTGVRSPAMWGAREHLQTLFGADAARLETRRRTFTFRYRSAEEWVRIFRTYYGPTHKAFAALSPKAQAALTGDMIELAESFNQGADGMMVVPSEYLEVVVSKRD